MPFSPMPGAVFLGRSQLGAAAADIPPVTWDGYYAFLMVYHFIAGYSGGGGIALLRLGTGATVDTGTNYSAMANHWTTSTTLPAGVPASSATGIKVANDSTTNARRGNHWIHNSAIAPKFVSTETVTYAAQNPTAATTVSSQSLTTGTWFQNAAAQSCGLNGGGVNLLTGSFIDVFGIPGLI